MQNLVADMAWNAVLSARADKSSGYVAANSEGNEDMAYEPTYRAKPIPKTLVLRWQDASSYGSGNDRYTRFGFNLPREVNGYNTLSLLSLGLDTAYYSAMGALLCVGIQEISTSALITSADRTGSRAFLPTFVVPNMGPFLQDPTNTARSPSYVSLQRPSPCVSVRGLDLTAMTVTLGDDSFQPLTLQSSLPGNFWCTLEMRLE